VYSKNQSPPHQYSPVKNEQIEIVQSGSSENINTTQAIKVFEDKVMIGFDDELSLAVGPAVIVPSLPEVKADEVTDSIHEQSGKELIEQQV
jgi:hypothetical protein